MKTYFCEQGFARVAAGCPVPLVIAGGKKLPELDALKMALARRRPEPGLIHHSDQGTQYTSIAFGTRCRQAGVRPSMGSVGDCFDNAMAESFFATLECELLERRSFKTQIEARMAVFDFIEGWYNECVGDFVFEPYNDARAGGRKRYGDEQREWNRG